MTPLPDAFPGSLARPVRVAPAAGGRQALRQWSGIRPPWTALPLALVFLWSAAGNPVAQADPLDHWTPLNPLPTGNRLNAVTYGAELYVAVGEFGTVIVSPDATNWTARPTGTMADLHGAAWGAGRWVAIGDAGTVLTSETGESWALDAVGETVRLRAITFGGDRFVAVGEGVSEPGEGQIWIASDGLDWTRIDLADLPPLLAVTSGPDGFLATGTDGRIFTSSDGMDWQPFATPGSGPWFGAAVRADLGVAVGTAGRVARSITPGHWTVIESGAEEWLYGVAHGPHPTTGEPVWVAAGAGGKILISEDGLSWQSLTSGWDQTLCAVTYGSVGFVAVGDHGMIRHWGAGRQGWAARSVGPRDWMVGAAQGDGVIVAGSVYFDVLSPGNSRTSFLGSADGAEWTQRSLTDFWLHRLIYGGGLFVAVGSSMNGDTGRIVTSPDGMAWTQRANPPVNWLFGVAHGNGRFVAVGENWLNFSSNSRCLLSTNGVNWTSQDSGTMHELAAVTWGNDRFVAVGHRGTVTVSLDGEDWSEHPSGTQEYLRAITWGDGLFVAVGHDGVLLSSTDGTVWTPRSSGTRQALLAVAYGGGWFVACGSYGTVLLSANGTEWTLRQVGSRARLSAVNWTGDGFVLTGNHGLLLRSGSFVEHPEVSLRPGIQLEPAQPILAAERREQGPALVRPMSGDFDTDLHHVAAIRHLPLQGFELVLDGAVPTGFEYDLFPVEVSANLSDWQPWRTFLRTNQLGRVMVRADDFSAEIRQRFYHTATNHYPATTLQPTGPYVVGRTLRWVESETHSVRRTFLSEVWYPAESQAGQVPGRFFSSDKLASRYASRNGRTETEFRTVRTHALENAPFAPSLTACPVVLVSHGWFGSNNGHRPRAEELASQGFVVVGIEGSDSFASLGPDHRGIVATHPAHEPSAAAFGMRVKDALALIDHLSSWNEQDPLLAGRLAPDNVGMLGWSMGGAAAIDVARLHPHCRAAVNLDGGVPHDYLRPGFSKALLFVGSAETHGEFPAVIRQFVESLPRDAAFFRIRNSNHGHLTEWHWWDDRRLRTRELTLRAITSFFRMHLQGYDDGFFDVLESQYPEVYDFVRR